MSVDGSGAFPSLGSCVGERCPDAQDVHLGWALATTRVRGEDEVGAGLLSCRGPRLRCLRSTRSVVDA